MPEYDNNMTGVLFRNTKREEGTKQPEFNGHCEIEGTKYQLAAWVKEGPKCGKFFSISIQPEWKPEGEPVAAGAQSEEIPF